MAAQHGKVGGFRHFSAEGVQLAHQLPLAHAAYRGVAGHQGHRVQVLGEEQGAGAEPGRGERRFAAGVPGADHYHVERVRVIEGRHKLSPEQQHLEKFGGKHAQVMQEEKKSRRGQGGQDRRARRPRGS